MVCVFASFVLGDDRSLKLFGFGLAVAVFIDATVVRLVLVPATMELLGEQTGGCRMAGSHPSRRERRGEAGGAHAATGRGAAHMTA